MRRSCFPVGLVKYSEFGLIHYRAFGVHQRSAVGIVVVFQTWGQTAGLKFNSSKTEVVIFTKKRLRPEQMPPKLKVSGQPVEFSTTAKYLGVTLDHNLTGTTHLNNQITKGKRYLFTLKKAVIKNWGPKPKFIKWMIDAIFMKRFMYGILVLSLIHI